MGQYFRVRASWRLILASALAFAVVAAFGLGYYRGKTKPSFNCAEQSTISEATLLVNGVEVKGHPVPNDAGGCELSFVEP